MSTYNSTSDPLGGPRNPPQQFAMLDILIPGFSVFTSAVHAYLGVDLNIYIPVILLLCGASWCWGSIYQAVWDFVEKHLMCSARIRTDDEIFNMVMGWVAAQKFSQNSRRFIANTNLNSKIWFLWRLWADDDDDEDDGEWRGVTPATKKKLLQYTPSFGKHVFWFHGRPLIFERSENRDANMGSLLASEKEEIHISCFGRSPALIKDLLMEARQKHMAKDEHKTIIYRGATDGQGGDMDWKRCMARSARPFSTVILNQDVKNELIEDVKDYLDPATRRWYANRGIPYRRGYLLHGPPGTGKSSLSLALAGHFKMRIYILSLSSPMATEENVASLFSSLPRRCVVLLEDIDSAGLTHTRENGSNTSNDEQTPVVAPPPPSGTKTTSPLTGRLSLSGLLNILDGVASQEGRVLIMTTNHIEKLDKALIRPGRVDMTVEFGRADSYMTSSIFRAIYSPYDGEVTPKIGVKQSSSSDSLDSVNADMKPSNTAAPAEKYADANKVATPQEIKEKDEREAAEAVERKIATDKVDELATTFASKVPEHEFSPAEIQGLLLKHKRDPLAAIADVDSWIERTRKEKAEKEVRDAEERRKKEKEEAKKKRKEERKKAKRKARKAKDKKKGGKKDKDESDSDGEGASGSDSDSESDSETEANTLKGESKDDKTDEAAEEHGEKKPGESKTEDGAESTEDKKEEKKDHKKKNSSDSGYGTP